MRNETRTFRNQGAEKTHRIWQSACSYYGKRAAVAQILDQFHARLIPSGRCGKTLINKYVSNPLRAARRGVCSPSCASVPLGPSLCWQSGSLQVYTEVLVGPLSRGSSFEMRWWADTEPADPDLLFEVCARALINFCVCVCVCVSCCIIRTSLLKGTVLLNLNEELTLLSSAYIPACLAGQCWFQITVTL